MDKGAFTLVEMVVYMFIVSIVGVFISTVSKQFFIAKNMNEKVYEYSRTYGSMLNQFYSDGYDGWILVDSNSTGVLLEKTGSYKGYVCGDNGVGVSVSTGYNQIEWSLTGVKYRFTGFQCDRLTGYVQDGGYWLDLDIDVVGRKHDLEFFIKN